MCFQFCDNTCQVEETEAEVDKYSRLGLKINRKQRAFIETVLWTFSTYVQGEANKLWIF